MKQRAQTWIFLSGLIDFWAVTLVFDLVFNLAVLFVRLHGEVEISIGEGGSEVKVFKAKW